MGEVPILCGFSVVMRAVLCRCRYV